MKNLLVIADPYGKPSFAPRLRFLCDYLCAKGWNIEVYTEKWDEIIFAHDYPIYEISLQVNKFTSSQVVSVEWAVKSFWSLLTDWKNRKFSRLVREQLNLRERRDATSPCKYDAVFCTTFSTFPLRAALEVAKEQNIPLFVDIRDLDEQAKDAQYQSHRAKILRPFRYWYKAVNIRRRNAVLRQATAVTTVSPWHMEFIKQFNPNTHLIYNGFDPRQHYPANVQTHEFIISYIGRTYEQSLQDPTLLMQALSRLTHLQGLKLRIYTNSEGQQRFAQLAQEYGIQQLTEIQGYVPIDQVPDLYRQSSICVVLTNQTTADGPFGMMTTKFFEILGCEKPLLCVRSDESTLAETIRLTHAGIAATNVEEVCDFILQQYEVWQTQGYTRQSVQHKDLFNRQHQAEQFEMLICQNSLS